MTERGRLRLFLRLWRAGFGFRWSVNTARRATAIRFDSDWESSR